MARLEDLTRDAAVKGSLQKETARSAVGDRVPASPKQAGGPRSMPAMPANSRPAYLFIATSENARNESTASPYLLVPAYESLDYLLYEFHGEPASEGRRPASRRVPPPGHIDEIPVPLMNALTHRTRPVEERARIGFRGRWRTWSARRLQREAQCWRRKAVITSGVFCSRSQGNPVLMRLYENEPISYLSDGTIQRLDNVQQCTIAQIRSRLTPPERRRIIVAAYQHQADLAAALAFRPRTRQAQPGAAGTPGSVQVVAERGAPEPRIPLDTARQTRVQNKLAHAHISAIVAPDTQRVESQGHGDPAKRANWLRQVATRRSDKIAARANSAGENGPVGVRQAARKPEEVLVALTPRSLSPRAIPLDWEVLPARWLHDPRYSPLRRPGRGASGRRMRDDRERLDRLSFLDGLRPLAWYEGAHLGKRVYYVALFDGIAIAESQSYGNALYFCPTHGNQWKQVLRLSKAEALRKGAQRLIHSYDGDWKGEVKRLVRRAAQYWV